MQLYSHRGIGFGLPESSMESFRMAISRGLGIECDLRLAKSGTVVINHDPLPNDIGALVTLDDVVALCKEFPKLKMLWELKEKDGKLFEKVADGIHENDLVGRITVISSNQDGLSYLGNSGVRTGIIDTWPSDIRARAGYLGVTAVLTGWTSLWEKVAFKALDIVYFNIKKQIEDLHADGYRVTLGVAKSSSDISYFKQLGADAVVSDVPVSKAVAYFAGGCFWCVESDFEKLPEVRDVISGFMGGSTPNPSYQDVSSGATKHREVVKVVYDPSVTAYRELVLHLLKHTDPTDASGSFSDRGRQYTSAIYYSTDEEKRIAESVIKKLDEENVYGKPIVTSVLPAGTFWVAETHHQNYYKKNPSRYKQYRKSSGRDAFIESVWGSDVRRSQMDIGATMGTDYM